MSPNHNVEFGLHLFKRRAGKQGVDRYTIGVWEGTFQRAICHDACIDCALAALRREMENAGNPAEGTNERSTRETDPSPPGTQMAHGALR